MLFIIKQDTLIKIYVTQCTSLESQTNKNNYSQFSLKINLIKQ